MGTDKQSDGMVSMTEDIMQLDEAALAAKHRRKSRWKKIVSVMACIVVFCTTYALILPAITLEKGSTVLACPVSVHQHEAECYGEDGSLICGQADYVIHTHDESCYDAEGNLVCRLPEIEAHEHDESCYDAEGNLTCDKEEIIAHTHDESCYDADGSLICGKLEVVEHIHGDGCFREASDNNAAAADEKDETAVVEDIVGESERSYTCEGDSYVVKVILPEDSTVPANAILRVHPITDTDESYETLARQAGEAVNGTAEEVLLYDISFYTSEEEYIPVEDTATVSFTFKESVLTQGNGNVAVLHYEEGADVPVALDEVDVARDENDALAGVTFQTEGFSVYAVVNVVSSGYERITDVAALNGKAVAILSNGAKYAMMAEKTSDGNGRLANAVASTADLSAYTFWTFEKNTDGKYYISSDGSYLMMGAQTLKTTTAQEQASAFTVTVTNGLAEIGVSVNGTSYYINLFGGENNPSGFKSYTNSSGNLQQLYYKKETGNTGGVPVTDLGESSYVIANLNTSARQYALSSVSTENGTRLSAIPLSIIAEGDTTYVSGDGLTTWTFESTDTAGVYYIKADDTGKYLSLASGALTTSDTGQAITVTTSDDFPGQVRLSANNMAVDWFGGSNANNLFFGPYNGTNQNDYQTLCQVMDVPGLLYNLDVSSTKVGRHLIDNTSGSAWQAGEEPVLTDSEGNEVDSVLQSIPDGGAYLYSPGTPGEDGCFTHIGTARQAIREKTNIGTEFRFDGWKAAAIDGRTYLFEANAEAKAAEDGIRINAFAEEVGTTDEKGNTTYTYQELDKPTEVVLSPGTTLTAQWKEVSDLALFFVNYTGTILDTENDVSGRNQKDFTGIIGIGQVYFGEQQAGNDTTFGNDANELIRLKFVKEFDPKDPEPQIVMRYVTVYDESVQNNSTANDPQKSGKGYNLYKPADGINDSELEVNLLDFIRANDNVTIKVSTSDNSNNPEIENENSTPDNYSVRWYVMKEQSDGWHIDGVMVAKTSEITVTKTFSGLTQEQVNGLLQAGSDEGYNIPIRLGSNRQNYITMTTKGIDGQYSYHGQEKDSSGAFGEQSYNWVLNAITDEQYTLSEGNYTLEGYDVSTIAVNYYKDADGQTKVAYGYSPTTEGLKTTDGATQEVIGGTTTAVSFNNFYTLTGTGALAITKRSKGTAENDTGGVLKGAAFTLYDENGTKEIATSASNSRGSAYFNNLAEGTYILKETQAPTGYLQCDDTWTVEVTKDDSGTVKVTVYKNDGDGSKTGEGTVCYDGGVKQSYTIENTPEAGTVRVTKAFSGLTAEQMELLVMNSTSSEDGGYYIEVSEEGNAGGTIDGSSGYAKLYLADAARSQDGFTFTWMITGLPMTKENVDGDNVLIQYNIVEYNYLIDDYIDAAVTAAVNDVKRDVLVYSYPDSENNKRCAKAGIYGITFNKDIGDRVEIANHYTNTFDLKIKKVDSSTGNALEGATFDIYGRYRDATDTSKTIRYMDADGNVTTYYYVGEITSGEDGFAEFPGLKLSNGTNTFLYVLDEIEAPDQYVKLKEPFAAVVTIDANGVRVNGSGTYEAGVLSVVAKNTKERDAVLTLKTKKIWEPSAPSDKTVTLQLYRVTHAERNVPLDKEVNAVLVKEITLNGVEDTKPEKPPDNTSEDSSATIPEPDVYESEPWVATWINIPSANTERTDSDEHYHYFVREVTQMDGYTTSYKCYRVNGSQQEDEDVTSEEGVFQTLTVVNEKGELVKDENGNPLIVEAVLIADMAEDYMVEITNTEYYELPETGGSGTLKFTIGGLLLTAGSLLYGYRLRRKQRKEVKM